LEGTLLTTDASAVALALRGITASKMYHDGDSRCEATDCSFA
jgi:hypothetical protein